MPRRQSTPMKYWGFYASTELREETIRCAIVADEDNSEYIRKAVEMRNAQMKPEVKRPVLAADVEKAREAMKKVNDRNGEPSIAELKEQVKDIEKPNQEFRSFFKDGGKK